MTSLQNMNNSLIKFASMEYDYSTVDITNSLSLFDNRPKYYNITIEAPFLNISLKANMVFSLLCYEMKDGTVFNDVNIFCNLTISDNPTSLIFNK